MQTCNKPLHVACSPDTALRMWLMLPCSLLQSFIMLVLSVVVKMLTDRLPAFSKHPWLIYVSALEFEMRKKVFCAGSALGSTSAFV